LAVISIDVHLLHLKSKNIPKHSKQTE